MLPWLSVAERREVGVEEMDRRAVTRVGEPVREASMSCGED